ncbi:nitrogen regulation protein NR(I) [Gammaproteobacteria bacterium]|jgi:two-component system nitrogen regulation response regulator GlnG|nr:nitrogen regulation protein NR(I) [Gammaproteobacteria bacterium]MDC1284763.1 nitrogen regulation protein NR(I) [Gammaproteobacteria bacterium]
MKNDVWVIDDDQSIRWVLDRALSKADFEVTTFEMAESAMQALSTSTPKVIVTDIRMPGMDGLDFLKKVQTQNPEMPIIVMTAHSDLDNAVTAYQNGAFEYLPKPFDVNEVVELAKRACVDDSDTLVSDAVIEEMPEIIGESQAMQNVFRAIGRLSLSSITVLINGETGTGKELVAKALHTHSVRKQKPFIALNMAAIPKDLLESELFGHEKGAFTGAQTLRRGRFEQADGGTLFLDEIGDMPADLQTRLLRVLSDGQFYRVGGHEPIHVDARIIAATHQDLAALVENGQFREDLMHRLNVIRIQVPALRERREDIPVLLKHFLHAAANELSVEGKQLEPEVTRYLSNLDWTGNVRQLENVARWLTVMASGKSIHMEDLPTELRENTIHIETNGDWKKQLTLWAEHKLDSGEIDILSDAVAQFESTLIEVAMRKSGGKRQRAAKLLGWGRNTLTRKIQELQMYEYSGGVTP